MFSVFGKLKVWLSQDVIVVILTTQNQVLFRDIVSRIGGT